MIRGILSALSTTITSGLYPKSLSNGIGVSSFISQPFISQQIANFTSLVPATSSTIPTFSGIVKHRKPVFLEPQTVSPEQIRTVTKFSLKKGRRKSVKAVWKRFFRLNWGIWIHTLSGRHKKLWKKSQKKRNYLLNHVFCSNKQSRMLDKMVTKCWRKPKYYIEDPYEVYQKRENFKITQTKPWRPEGVDYE